MSELASPGELVAAVSDALAVPEATVRQLDRNLAAEGLRIKLGRGSSAAKVTAIDVANLLIAIAAAPMAGPTVKSAALTCRYYAGLIALNARGRPMTFPAESLGVYQLAELPAGHTFRDALASIIDCARSGVLDRAGNRSKRGEWTLWVHLEGPIASANIAISTKGLPEIVGYKSQKPKTLEPPRIWPGDLRQNRHFTHKTIRAMAKLLGPLNLEELDATLSQRFKEPP